MKKILALTLPLLAGLLLAGCAPDFREEKAHTVVQSKFTACYGYGCQRRVNFPITQTMTDRFSAIMRDASASNEAERAAISKAIQYYEDLSADRIGARDDPKSPFAATGKLGQMDCIDESTNSRHLLLYLEARGLLTHYKVEANETRGLLIDGRYPHWTAVIRQIDNKEKWAVDSWYEAAGGPPDILPLDYWYTRGVMGER